MEKWGFILNPAAGEGRAEKLSAEIQKHIDSFKPGSTLKRTKYTNHATEIAAEYLKEGYTHIIIIGGDGTVNEAARSLVNTDIVLGVIPAGTGNDFLQISGFREEFSDSDWKEFFSAHHRPIDVGLCNGNYFFNGMGIGFDAEMTAAVTEDRIKTGRISKSKYTYFIVKTLLWYKERIMKFIIDDRESTERSFMTTCSIGRRFAGGFYLTPKAVADDGLLDVLKINPLTLPQRLNILLKVPKGTHLSHRRVDYFTAARLKLEFDHSVSAHLDGELTQSAVFDISLIKGGLNLIVKPEGPHYLEGGAKGI